MRLPWGWHGYPHILFHHGISKRASERLVFAVAITNSDGGYLPIGLSSGDKSTVLTYP
jgi:hypothetical protein